jgi:hypothetical protein
MKRTKKKRFCKMQVLVMMIEKKTGRWRMAEQVVISYLYYEVGRSGTWRSGGLRRVACLPVVVKR